MTLASANPRETYRQRSSHHLHRPCARCGRVVVPQSIQASYSGVHRICLASPGFRWPRRIGDRITSNEGVEVDDSPLDRSSLGAPSNRAQFLVHGHMRQVTSHFVFFRQHSQSRSTAPERAGRQGRGRLARNTGRHEGYGGEIARCAICRRRPTGRTGLAGSIARCMRQDSPLPSASVMVSCNESSRPTV
jgi:hypothetical protein